VSSGDLSRAECGDVAVTRSSRESFEEFVGGTSARLLTVAMLLTGQHRADAEDLLQAVLERAYRRWRRICRYGDPAPYVRRMLVNAAMDRRRMLRRHREEPLGQAGQGPATGDQAGVVDDRDLLLRALGALSPGQRAVIVLRYYEDLSEAQTAALLGCSIGSVKTQASRALAKLRGIVTGGVLAVPGDPEIRNHGGRRS